jgi:AraC-like DNA-binding protein
MDGAVIDTTTRLLTALQSAEDARILGPQLVRELVYRVLRGPLGKNLRELATPRSHFGRISRVLNRIHTEFDSAFDMAELAREAGMSSSTFHTHFKAMTASSPLQYLKTIRLHKARMLMVHDGASASSAASRVGYESASQFSREFKRHFGDAPAAVATLLRKQMVRLA